MNAQPVTRYKTGCGRRVSFEFFPPKTEDMKQRLWSCLDRLLPLEPDFVSVTYGAGGTTRALTHATVKRMVEETPARIAAHLTCVGATRHSIMQIVDDYRAVGVRHIVALRGDAPTGMDQPFKPFAGGFRNSVELIENLRNFCPSTGGRLEISVACYPEQHPESPDWQADIAFLKAKQDAGADRAITQFFFESGVYLRFLERCRAAGVTIPIVPGVMLQPNFSGLKRFARLCRASLPDWLCKLYDDARDDAATRDQITADIAVELCRQLVDHGVGHFHFFTLNRADLALRVCRSLGLGGTRSPHSGTHAWQKAGF